MKWYKRKSVYGWYTKVTKKIEIKIDSIQSAIQKFWYTSSIQTKKAVWNCVTTFLLLSFPLQFLQHQPFWFPSIISINHFHQNFIAFSMVQNTHSSKGNNLFSSTIRWLLQTPWNAWEHPSQVHTMIGISSNENFGHVLIEHFKTCCWSFLGESPEIAKILAKEKFQQNPSWSWITYVECTRSNWNCISIRIRTKLWHPLLTVTSVIKKVIIMIKGISLSPIVMEPKSNRLLCNIQSKHKSLILKCISIQTHPGPQQIEREAASDHFDI